MAKNKKYPKKPKKSASLSVWQNFESKIKEIDKHNAQLSSDKKKKEALIKKLK